MLMKIECPKVVIDSMLEQEEDTKMFRASEIANELAIKRALFGFI